MDSHKDGFRVLGARRTSPIPVPSLQALPCPSCSSLRADFHPKSPRYKEMLGHEMQPQLSLPKSARGVLSVPSNFPAVCFRVPFMLLPQSRVAGRGDGARLAADFWLGDPSPQGALTPELHQHRAGQSFRAALRSRRDPPSLRGPKSLAQCMGWLGTRLLSRVYVSADLWWPEMSKEQLAFGKRTRLCQQPSVCLPPEDIPASLPCSPKALDGDPRLSTGGEEGCPQTFPFRGMEKTWC